MKITGMGSYLPPNLVTSEDLDVRFGYASGHVLGQCSVVQRHYVTADESQITMGAAAARRALTQAGVAVADIDLVIGASAVPYQPIPATAPAYMRALGFAEGAAFGFDVNSTCLSFLSALDVADGFLQAGRYARILIIASEVASRALPWPDKPQIAGLFGDGAAAVVVEAGGAPIVSRFKTYPSILESCGIGAGGTRFDFRAEPEAFAAHSLFDMDGKALFRLTSQHFVPFVELLLKDAGWDIQDVDLVVPHQASPLALTHMIRQCGFDPDKVVDVSRTVGNQIAASIPFALAYAAPQAGRGRRDLMLGTSAGVSFGGAAVRFS